MTARREFGAAIAACVAGAGLVLLALRQGWARVDYAAPKPLPSASIPVSGQELLPAVGALALAALACLAAIIATRGLARRMAGLALAGLGAWIAALVSQPVRAATVVAAASGQAAGGALTGTLPGGNSAISGNSPASGGLPEIGAASRVVLDSVPWRPAAVAGALAVLAAGLLTAWRGPRWAVMPGRFDRPAQAVPGHPQGGGVSRLVPAAPGAAVQSAAETGLAANPGVAGGPVPAGSSPAAGGPVPAGSSPAAGGPVPAGSSPAAGGPVPAGSSPAAGGPVPAGSSPAAGGPVPAGSARSAARPGLAAGAPHPDGDAAALWEALDRGEDLTDTPEAGPEPAPARGEAQP